MRKLLALDIETTGLNPRKDKITLIGVYDGNAYASFSTARDLARYLHEEVGPCDIVAHNGSFDIGFILVDLGSTDFRDSLPIVTLHDTQVMAHVHHNKPSEEFLARYEAKRQILNKELPRGVSHRKTSDKSLKVLAPYFLKAKAFWENPENHNDVEYNRKDCEYTYRLYEYFRENMTPDETSFYEKRMLPWLEMLIAMEQNGIAYNNEEHKIVLKEYEAKEAAARAELDRIWASHHLAYQELQKNEIAKKYEEMLAKALVKAKDKDKCRARYQALQVAAEEKVEQKINFDSPKQMAWLLRDRMGLDITKTDNEEEESTGKAILNQLAASGRTDISKYLEWREAQKVLTMYLPTYSELQYNETIYPRFNLTGTRTGRLSSSSPNLQQVPSKLYRLFKPRPGHIFVKYDYGAIEAVLIAMFSNDSAMTTIVTKGLSIHDYTTKMVFNITDPIEQIKEKHAQKRKAIKNVTFGCLYGAGANRIKTVFMQAGIPMTDGEAREIREKIRETYPEAFAFHREVTGIFEDGGTILNLLGRPINIQNREDAYMKGFNTLVQSSASDLALVAAVKTLNAWNQKGINGRHLALIHDAILSEVPIDFAVEADIIMKETMTKFSLKNKFGQIPLSVEGGVSLIWD